MPHQGYSTSQTGRSRPQSSGKLPTPAQAIAARKLFGSFRKGEANDPETYVASILTVLMEYDDAVVNEVCHPTRGLPTRCDFLPTIKELKDACESEAARVERLAKMAALPTLQPMGRLPRPVAKPGDYANVRVPANAPQFERMVRLTEVTDKRKWKYDAEGVLWVTYDMLDTPAPMVRDGKAGPKRYTDEDLERLYPKTRATEPAPHADEMDAVPF